MMRVIARSMVPLLLVSTSATAQLSEARDQAAGLATITAAHDLCKFELTPAEEDVIARRRDALVEAGSVTPRELADINAGIAASMKRQVVEGLCRPNGPAAKFYRSALDALAPH